MSAQPAEHHVPPAPDGNAAAGMALAGKLFVPQDDSEHDCTVTELSPEGATLKTADAIGESTKVVLYLERFDRFAGVIARCGEGELVMRFECSPAKQERTAERIAQYRAGTLPEGPPVRQARRATAGAARSFVRPGGQEVFFEVRDISLTGASLKTGIRPPIGEIVMIGDTAGRVARYFEDGIAVEFIRGGEQPPGS